MSTEITTVNVTILDRVFSIKCPITKITELQKAAQHLDEKMRQIQKGNKFISIDKVAIIAAINITHEAILASSQNASQLEAIATHTSTMTNKIQEALK